jgi:hypothetical protein
MLTPVDIRMQCLEMALRAIEPAGAPSHEREQQSLLAVEIAEQFTAFVESGDVHEIVPDLHVRELRDKARAPR